MHFADFLTEQTRKKSPVCVGLDPVIAKLPDGITKDVAGVFAFGKGIVDAVNEIAACIKPNLAFYELLGWEGMKVFWETCAYAKSQGLIVIADGKRNDIGSTCEAYADAYLYEGSPVDALTVTPFMGSDGVLPFVDRCVKNEKGIFVQVKNSNKSSGELQDLPAGDEVVHEHLAQLVESWATVGACHGMPLQGPESSLSCVGAVVGALYPEEMKYLRTLMPHCPFLIPGYGAQGGTAEDVKHGFIRSTLRSDSGQASSGQVGSKGAIVSASRSIIYASGGKDWKEAAGKAAGTMAEQIRKGMGRIQE